MVHQGSSGQLRSYGAHLHAFRVREVHQGFKSSNVSRQVSVPSCSKYLLMAGVRISVIYSVTSIAADSIGVLV